MKAEPSFIDTETAYDRLPFGWAVPVITAIELAACALPVWIIGRFLGAW